jgi:hypothetical protein
MSLWFLLADDNRGDLRRGDRPKPVLLQSHAAKRSRFSEFPAAFRGYGGSRPVNFMHF